MNEEKQQESTATTEFDPSTLPEEAKAWFEAEKQKYADTRVTSAVKKAEARIKGEMANDAELRAKIRQEVEYEATLTAEDKVRIEREKVEAELKNLKKESNALLVKKELLSYGFDDASIDRLTGLVVSEDKDVTLTKLKELTDTYSEVLSARMEKEKLSLLERAGGTPPSSGSVTQGEKAEYIAQFNQAKTRKDEATAARILRESQSKGIDIFR